MRVIRATPERNQIYWRIVLRLLTKGWTQYANARFRNDHSCPSDHPKAVCYCLNGAMCRAEQIMKSQLGLDMSEYEAHKDLKLTTNRVDFNDSLITTKLDVLAVVGRTLGAFSPAVG